MRFKVSSASIHGQNERLSSLNFEDTHCASIPPVRLLAEAQDVRPTSDQKNESGVFTSRLPKKYKNAGVVSDASFGLKQTTYASPDTPFRSVIVVIKPSIDMRVMQRVMQPRSNASSYDIGCCVPSRRLLVKMGPQTLGSKRRHDSRALTRPPEHVRD